MTADDHMPAHRARTLPRRAFTRRWLFAVLGVALLTAVAIPLYGFGRMLLGSTTPATEGQLASAGVGRHVEVAYEVTQAPIDAPPVGTVLERSGEGTYRRTERTLQIRWGPETVVVMGQRENVRPGAVLQVGGQLASRDLLVAERMVVLTGAVRVQ